jgi:DNA polymerase type B, organellar and viral
MIKKYDNHKIYVHKLANFDAIFLLKILANLGTIKPVIHHDTIISIQFNMNGYVVTFRDSNQLLPKSLRELGNAFGVDVLKSIFPYSFINESRLTYNSHVPELKYFSNVSKAEYQDYLNSFKNKTWNLEAEIIKYCIIDCVTLYQIIDKFSAMIYELYHINIHKYPTVSSLAFAIYRTNFIIEGSIPQLSGQIAKDIRESYTGGVCWYVYPWITRRN